MRQSLGQNINRVAEVHFFLRPMLVNTLKNRWITPAGKQLVGDYDTYHDYWQASFGDKFFDMATMIRLGTTIENCLKRYYMDQKEYSTLIDLQNDSRHKKNIFQRIQSWQSDGAIQLYKDELGYDLTTNPHLSSVQEAMVHRHLYAHNSGLLDEDYIKNIRKITGEDLTERAGIMSTSYPAEDVYWFQPLEKLNVYIEEARRFFRQFP